MAAEDPGSELALLAEEAEVAQAERAEHPHSGFAATNTPRLSEGRTLSRHTA